MIDLDKSASGIWTVTVNRPDKANALTEDMLMRLCDIAQDATNARALILTGAGKVFSAGADLDAAKAGLATSPLWEKLSERLAALDGLTICAMNGTVAGGAMGMALACDLRISTPQAKIFYPVMRLGFLPQPSDPKRLSALIGPARAKMILMAGQKIGANEALQWGLIDRIIEDDLLQAAHLLAHDSLNASPDHAASIKRMISRAIT